MCRMCRFLCDRFKALNGWKKFFVLAYSFCLLFMAIILFPPIPYFVTEFQNLDDVNIGDFQAVRSISWGIWRACYENVNRSICTRTSWISNPYTFNIIENGNQAHATVQQEWMRVLFTLFAAFFYTFFIILFTIVVINTGLSRAKFFHTNFYIFAYSSLAIVSLFILIAVTFVLESIKNEMVELAPGGIVSVITKPYVGYILTVMAYVSLFAVSLFCVVAATFTKWKEEKDLALATNIATANAGEATTG